MGAVREALDEKVAARALEVALDELQRRIVSQEPAQLEAEISTLDTKIERALDLAIELGDLEAAKNRLRDLKDERAGLTQRLDQSRVTLPNLDELMPRLREKLREIESTLRADVSRGRKALGALLGETRLRVYADGRIEGLATLAPETLAPPKRTPEARDWVVAGEGFDASRLASFARSPPTSGL